MVVVEILTFLDALFTFFVLLCGFAIWLQSIRYWVRILMYNVEVNAKFVDYKYKGKDKKEYYGIYTYKYNGKTYTGVTVHTLDIMDKVRIDTERYCKVYLCKLFPNKLCTRDYKNFSWFAIVADIIGTLVVIFVVGKILKVFI